MVDLAVGLTKVLLGLIRVAAALAGEVAKATDQLATSLEKETKRLAKPKDPK